MNTNTEPSPDKRTRETAWSWLVTNLVVLPGLGSILGGRKVGFVQAGLAIAGMILSLVFVFSLIREWWALRTLPAVDSRWLFQGLGGIVLFGVAWVWGLVTGLELLRDGGKRR